MGTIDNTTGGVTITASGAGDHTVGTVTTTGNITLTASGSSGTDIFNMSGSVTSGKTVTATLGSGITAYTTAGPLVVDTLTLTSADGTDTINQAAVAITSSVLVDVINNFDTDEDIFSFSITAAGAPQTGNSGTSTTSTAVAFATSAESATLATGTTIIGLSAYYATTALAEVGFETLTGFTTAFASGDDFFVAWYDGSDTHLGIYLNNTSTTTAISGGVLYEIAQLVGVDISDLATANFDIIT